MRLSEVQVREKVPTVGPGEASVRLVAKDGPAAAFGWSLDYEAGVVTATKGDVEMLIPVGNVAYMRKLVVPVEAKKPVKAA